MPDRQFTGLLEALTLALHNARIYGIVGCVWQLPGGEWQHGPVIPAEAVYLRVSADGSVSGCCDACERVREEGAIKPDLGSGQGEEREAPGVEQHDWERAGNQIYCVRCGQRQRIDKVDQTCHGPKTVTNQDGSVSFQR